MESNERVKLAVVIGQLEGASALLEEVFYKEQHSLAVKTAIELIYLAKLQVKHEAKE